MPDDPLAPALAAIRDDIAARDELLGSTDWDRPDDASRFNAAQDKVAARVPPLLAAIEAVLKPHQPGRVTIYGSLCKHHANHRDFSITRAEADGVRACPDCTATVYPSCSGCGPHVSADACPVRAAITAALTGTQPDEERSDG